METERHSLQEVIRARQQKTLPDREAQIARYQHNLGLAADDQRRRFLFNIHGDAGIGKTYLTQQLRQVASDSGAVTAYIDDKIEDLTSVMTAIAAEFRRSGTPLVEFEKRVAVYQKRRRKLESDPHAPVGVASLPTKAAVTIGVRIDPSVPIPETLLVPLDATTVADQLEQTRMNLVRKFSEHVDVRLLLSPTEELTPLFVNGLTQVAPGRPIAFFFDAYERTAPFLDHWLRNLYARCYGNLPATLVTTISGQHPLNPNLWDEYLSVIADIPLKPFSGPLLSTQPCPGSSIGTCSPRLRLPIRQTNCLAGSAASPSSPGIQVHCDITRWSDPQCCGKNGLSLPTSGNLIRSPSPK